MFSTGFVEIYTTGKGRDAFDEEAVMLILERQGARAACNFQRPDWARAPRVPVLLLPTLPVPSSDILGGDTRVVMAVPQGVSAAKYDPDEPWKVRAVKSSPKAVRDWYFDAEAPKVGHSEGVVNVVNGPEDLIVTGAIGNA